MDGKVDVMVIAHYRGIRRTIWIVSAAYLSTLLAHLTGIDNSIMKMRYALLLLLSLLYACSDSNHEVSDPGAEASVLAAQLSAPHTPANEAFLLSLLRNELGSDPFYLIEYRELRDDQDDTRALLASYEQVLTEHLQQVGAYTAFDNVVLQQVTNPEVRVWHQPRFDRRRSRRAVHGDDAG